MIEQQYYTRERGGLFSQTDGYDTVAKTPLLKLEYINKNIHPLCNYDIPSELQKNGETDENKYPPNFIIFPTSTGELIVGQAVYKSKDFTGLRPTFFMHNFVLSEKERRRYVKEPEKLFGITGFATSYSEEEGRELPTLAGIPYEGVNPYFQDRAFLFTKIGMDEALFHKLMYATFVAANSKKKIFIVLDVSIEELGELAKALLYHLYLEMPWSITEKLGVCTYSSRLEAKKRIQITFLDQYTLRYDTKISKEFIFDFVNRKFLNVDEDMESEPYMQICSQYTHNKLAWEKFNKWADELSMALKDKIDKGLDYYSKVAVLLEMSLYSKSRASYDMTKHKVRKGLMTYLLKKITGNLSDEIKAELTEVLEYTIVLLHARISVGELFSLDEIEVLLCFKLLNINQGILEQEAHCILIILALLEEAGRQGQVAYIEALLEAVKSYPSSYIQLYKAIYERPKLKETIAYRMIDDTLKGVTTFNELMSQMQKLELIEPILLLDSYYRQRIYAIFEQCLHVDGDKVMLLLQVQKWCQNHTDALYEELREACESYFIEHVNLKEIDTEKTICALKFSHSYPDENYEIIRDYQRLRTDLSFMSPQKIRVNSKVQELIKIFYKKNVRKDDFYMLVYAFLEPGTTGDELQMNLKKVLSYLNAISPEIMLDFIVWSKGQEVYINKGTFDNQVITFFTNMKQKEGKIPKELIKTKLGYQVKTKALCKKILKAQKPMFLKWIAAHQKGVLVGGSLLVVGLGVGMGACYYYQSSNDTKGKESFKEMDIDLALQYKLVSDVWTNNQEVESYIEAQQEEISQEEVSQEANEALQEK